MSPCSWTRPSHLPFWKPQTPPSPQWCLKVAGQDTRRLPLLTSRTFSFRDVLMSVSALFCLPPNSVGSSLLLCYRDSDGDSCTFTSATFSDALPLFLHSPQCLRFSCQPPLPLPPPLTTPLLPSPKPVSTHRPVMPWLASRPTDLFVLTFIVKIRMLLSPHGASIIRPTLLRPLPDRPSLNSFVMSPPKASKFFVPSKQASFHPTWPCFSSPGATPNPSHIPGSSLRQCPVPGSWTAGDILSASRWTFGHPGLAWTSTPGAGGHKQIRTKFAMINHWNTGVVNVQASGCPHCLQPSPVHSPWPGSCSYHSRPNLALQSETTKTQHSSGQPFLAPHRLATPFFHIPLVLSGTLPAPQLWLVLSLCAT